MTSPAPAPGAPTPAPATPPAPRSLDADADRSGIVTVMMAATLLRFWQLGKNGLSTDEALTWSAAQQPLATLFQRSPFDGSPPFYSLLTSLALRLGDSEAHLRLVSVLASVGLVWLTYRFARLFSNRTTSTLAAGITALSAYQLQYAQEARPYMTAGFLTVLALYLFVRAVMLHRRKAWAPFVVASVLALHTQGVALLGAAVQPVASPSTFHSVFLVLRSVFLSPLPVVSAMPGSSMPGLDKFVPPWILHTFLVVVTAVPLLGGVSLILEKSRRGQMVRLMTAALFLPLIVAFVLSFERPLWLPRYFPFLTPFVSVLMAVGIARLRRWVAMAWTVVLFLIAGHNQFRYFTHYTKEPWREVAGSIVERSAPGAAAVLVTFDADPMRYYNARLPGSGPVFEVSHAGVPLSDSFSSAQLREMEDATRVQTRGYRDVWLVMRKPELPGRKEVEARTRKVAGEGRALAVRERWDSFQGPLYVWCWRRPTRPVP
jgi:mannosyltransferase